MRLGMGLPLKFGSKLTFSERFTRTAIFFGIPLLCYEFFQFPKREWTLTLFFVELISAMFGSLTFALLEHGVVQYVRQRHDGVSSKEGPIGK